MTAPTEDTPLLGKSPIPWDQVWILLMIQLCSPLAGQSIYPYINRLISDLDIVGGDARKIGYYAGLIESLFFAVQALSVLHWSRYSDRVGRKPVMLVGVFGLSISMLGFGLSRTFWGLIISRCLCGLLNGNIGVVKSGMAELTDSTNRAQVFAFIPLVWSIGCSFGPLIGGSLFKPNERFPTAFKSEFWGTHPHFLPCATVASFAALVAMVTLTSFHETLPKRPQSHRADSEGTLVGQSSLPETVSWREILIFPVLISIANYTFHTLIYTAFVALIPLFFSTPLEIGGVGFDPVTIGYAMGSYGIFTGIVQVCLFPKLVRYFGPKRLLVNGAFMFLPFFCLMPLISYLAQRTGGVTPVVLVCICIMPLFVVCIDMSFACILLYVMASAPKRALGATNGLSQMLVSTARAISPAMATSLFSFSIEHNLLGGYGVYTFYLVLSCVGVVLALCLPNELWPETED